MEFPVKNNRIAFATETLGEVLRHFSRKDLSQQIYLVNRHYYSVATSNSHVPVIHFIGKISFDCMPKNGESTEVVNFVRIRKDRLREDCLETQFGIPGPFVRFGHVSLKHLHGQAMLNFLSKAKESFVGCNLNISLWDDSKLVGIAQSYIHQQVRYLLQNVFYSPLSITICDQNWFDPDSIIETITSSNCRRLELHFNRKSAQCTEITNRALLDWLKTGNEQRSDGHHEHTAQKKHLVLESYPRNLILSLIEPIREDFEYIPSYNAEFVITFIQCRGSPLQILDPFDEFSLVNISTNDSAQRLSFFKYNPPNSKTHDRAYRLWRRSVTSEAADSAKLSFLQSGEEIQGNVEFDQNIFSFEFPLCNKAGLYYF